VGNAGFSAEAGRTRDLVQAVAKQLAEEAAPAR